MYCKPYLDDFCRVQWVSPKAHDIWAARIRAISRAWKRAEINSVSAGLRSASIQIISPDELGQLKNSCFERGLVVEPIGKVSISNSYSASSNTPSEGEPYNLRVVVTTPASARAFMTAYKSSDNDAIGMMLGYPKCCREFYMGTWEKGSVDPTWYMTDHSVGPVEVNILLRWFGVRLIPHMPCSFSCRDSEDLGKSFKSLLPDPEKDWTVELLSMPMKWSSLFGIGEVVTPIATANFRSDYSTSLREIRRDGPSYPVESAKGLTFPYKPTQGESYSDSLWSDNGFNSYSGMLDGHMMILDRIRKIPSSLDQGVIDLGCGNGYLLSLVRCRSRVGIEADKDKVRRAVEGIDIICGDIRDVWNLLPDRKFGVALLSENRVKEMSESEKRVLLKWISDRCQYLILYSYDNMWSKVIKASGELDDPNKL